MSERVLLISIEAMELGLLRQGVEEGWLPTFGALLREGAAARLVTEPDVVPGGTWPTLLCGRPAEDHLLTFHRQLRPGTYRIEPTRPDHMRQPPFWQFVSDAGRRSTVVSVHSTPRLHDFLGTQVSWGTPEPHVARGVPWSDPPDVLSWLQDAFPRRRWGFLPRLPRSQSEFRTYLNDARRGVREQGEAMAMLMERTEWDLFFGNFAETHEFGHLMWHFEKDAAPADLRHAVRRLYEDVDKALHQLVERTSQDTCVFLVSPNGMRTAYPTAEATEAFLMQGGWLALRDRSRPSQARSGWWAARARAAARRLTPITLRQAAGSRWPGMRARVEEATTFADVDWSRSSAFPLPQDMVSSIRLNVVEREPEGTVERGASYDNICRDIAATATELTDEESGEVVADAVHRMDRLIGEPVTDILADIVIEWSPRSFAAVAGPHTGRIEVPDTDRRTGYHTSHGFLMGRGPGIRPGRGDHDFEREPWSLLDVAPTILSALGVPVPPTLPGRSIKEFGNADPAAS